MKKMGAKNFYFLWALGGSLYYGFEVFFRGFSHWSMFVLGGICLFILCQTGTLDRMEGAVMETGALVYNLCDSSGIYHGNDRESVAWMECMGLYRKKMAAVRSDLSAVYHYFSALCVIGILLSGYLLYWLYGEEKPHFHVL